MMHALHLDRSEEEASTVKETHQEPPELSSQELSSTAVLLSATAEDYPDGTLSSSDTVTAVALEPQRQEHWDVMAGLTSGGGSVQEAEDFTAAMEAVNMDLDEMRACENSTHPVIMSERHVEEHKESFLERAGHALSHALHLDNRVEAKEMRYLVDNSELQHDTDGLCYRRSKHMDDKVDTLEKALDIAPWGEFIDGIDEGDGWVRVRNAYLPKTLGDKTVLKPEHEVKAHHAPEEKEHPSLLRVPSFEPTGGQQSYGLPQTTETLISPARPSKAQTDAMETLVSPARASKVSPDTMSTTTYISPSRSPDAVHRGSVFDAGVPPDVSAAPDSLVLQQLCQQQAQRIAELESKLNSSEPHWVREMHEMRARHEWRTCQELMLRCKLRIASSLCR